MESIFNLIGTYVSHERLEDIGDLAEKLDPQQWHENRQRIVDLQNKLIEKGCKDEAIELDDLITGEETKLQKAAYMIGLADGMKLSELREGVVVNE